MSAAGHGRIVVDRMRLRSVIGENGFGLRGLAAMESGIVIEAIGQVRVTGLRGAEAAQSTLAARSHVRSLMALLASCPQGVAADDLVDALWPAQARVNGRGRLHHTVHLARQVLNAAAGPGEWIRAETGRFMLSQEIWTDVRELHDVAMKLEEVAPKRFARAMSYCYADWAPDIVASEMAQRLRRQVAVWQKTLLKEFARRALESEDLAEGTRALVRCLELDPVDEEAYSLQIQMELETRRPLAASRVLAEAARNMSANLGLRPSAVLRALAAQAHVLGTVHRSSSLPARPGRLLGRRSLLRALTEEMVAAPGVWVLHGVAGSGRSALGAELAHRIAPHCPGGAFWLRCAPQGPPVETALAAMAPRGTEPLRWLSNLQGLLVIDDFDVVAGAWAWLERLPPAAACRVVVICLRQPERQCRGGSPWRITNVPRLTIPLRLADVDSAERVLELEDESWRLFRLLWRATMPQEPAAQQELFSLLQWLDGLPLAIRLAAERCGTLTPGELLRMLRGDQGLSALESPQEVLASDAVAGMQPVFARSLSKAGGVLSDEERTVLHVLSTFSGPFTLIDAEELLRRLDLPTTSSHRQAIEALHGIGLVVTDVLSGRIRLLNTQRLWAREDARRVGRWDALLNARIELLTERLRQDECGFESNRYSMWIAGIREYLDETRQLLSGARSLGGSALLALLRPLAHAWSLLPAPEPLSFWIDRCLAEPGDWAAPETELELLTLGAAAWLEAGDHARALHYADLGVPRLDMAGKTPSALAAYFIGMRIHLLRLSGRYAAAREFGRQALLHLGPEDAGFWSLHLWRVLSATAGSALEVTAADLAMLRERLTGSRLWGDLMRWALHGAVLRSQQECDSLAEDMRAWARQTGAASFEIRAERLLVSASLASDDLESASSRLLKWAQTSTSTAPGQSAQAFWWLADISWRRGAQAAALRWHHEASKAVIGSFSLPFQLALQSQKVVIELQHGNTDTATDLFLAMRLPESTLSDRGRWELAVEAAALLARSVGQITLARSLQLWLGPLTRHDRASPLVHRSREVLGTPSAPERWMVQHLPLELVKQRVRDDIAALVGVLRSERESRASRSDAGARA